ncbi:MAG TPA: amidohydrolase family protein [Streptosporangiaceae bacterium]|jgi:predicted TIM-barrel fold metal-dependent hydrolase
MPDDNPEDIDVKIIAIEEHWNSAGIRAALDRLPDGARHITSSGMLQERLLRHTLDFTGAGEVLFSTDYPFHQPGRAAVGQFFDAIPDPADRSKIASGNAEALFHLTW